MQTVRIYSREARKLIAEIRQPSKLQHDRAWWEQRYPAETYNILF